MHPKNHVLRSIAVLACSIGFLLSTNHLTAAEDASLGVAREIKELRESHAKNEQRLKLLESGLVGEKADKANSTFLNIELFTGAKLQNPYSIQIDPTTKAGTLNPSESKPVAFVELNVFARHIFRTGVYDETFTPEEKETNTVSWERLFKNEYFLPEFDFRVGYAFTGDKPEQFEAATIAGGSDVYLEGGIGQPLLRVSNHHDWKGQISAEFAGGFTTDDAFNKVHPNLFFGAGFQMAYTPAGPTNVVLGNTYVLFRTGYGSFDQPKLTNGRNVAMDDFDLPRFEQEWAPTFGATMVFKMNRSLSFQLTSNVYFADRANWNISAGLSLDPAKFFKP
jgi:hypothetical protein